MTMNGNESIAVALNSHADVHEALQLARTLAVSLDFPPGELARTMIAIAEIARNAVIHAHAGLMTIGVEIKGNKTGLVIVTEDRGPGIYDLELALREGYSTAGGLGIGLPGAKRMMDEFDIVSEVGKGTVITMKKWKP